MEEPKDEMREQFLPQLNEFTELQKQAHRDHVEYILQLSKWQKNLIEENEKLKERWKAMDKPDLAAGTAFWVYIEEQLSARENFLKSNDRFYKSKDAKVFLRD